eukprot:gnl/MRDRNA2_/MRDRNA2_64233_c0_seq1.p2 gnl/MRDRNA2_/MRDRNA2_64233_c0~~gnl/MRDRNA2_/MRDRNA2_64233_c0_seq1.p2  ORF type:complete len:324 (-),score=55.15 gnl/MRDRNA2_/MRDRNA2_64233_c0_seq1:1091-2062(-)
MCQQERPRGSKEKRASWVGDNHVPLIQGASQLQDNQFEKIVSSQAEDMKLLHSIDGELFDHTKKDSERAVACAVSDPSLPDCPLVYVSKGFETLTGFSRDFVIGRNCRFLQPKNKAENDEINGEERSRMRNFCMTASEGRMVNLILNEAKNGTRFWNMLRMSHIEIDGRRYIFAIQTTLDFAVDEIVTMAGMQALARIRHELRKQFETTTVTTTPLNNMLRACIGDWVQLSLQKTQQTQASAITSSVDEVDTKRIPKLGIDVREVSKMASYLFVALREGVEHVHLSADYPGYKQEIQRSNNGASKQGRRTFYQRSQSKHPAWR